jgi:excisionase family DNA binding protein
MESNLLPEGAYFPPPEPARAKRPRRKAGVGRTLAQSVDDFASAIDVGRTTLYAEIAAGRLRAYKIGKRTLILEEDSCTFLVSLPELQAA